MNHLTLNRKPATQCIAGGEPNICWGPNMAVDGFMDTWKFHADLLKTSGRSSYRETQDIFSTVKTNLGGTPLYGHF